MCAAASFRWAKLGDAIHNQIPGWFGRVGRQGAGAAAAGAARKTPGSGPAAARWKPAHHASEIVMLRAAVVVLLAVAVAGCAASPSASMSSVDGPTCRRGVTRTFWVPCPADRLLRT